MDETKINFPTENESANPQHHHRPIETELRALFTAGQPDQDFADQLEVMLRKRAAGLITSSARKPNPAWRTNLSLRPILAISVIIVLLMLAAITALGPQRVLAAVQNLLGYVPGIGFVDLEEARMLAAPISMTQEDITFELEQVVASADGTRVAFKLRSADALSLEPRPEAASKSTKKLELFHGFNPAVVLPTGERFLLTSMRYNGSGCCWRGLIQFPPLPAEAHQAWLEFEIGSESFSGQEGRPWKVPFTLHSAAEVWQSEEALVTIIPDGARVTVNGVTVEILQIVRATSETAVQLQMRWEPASWTYWPGSNPWLRDDVGHTYFEVAAGESASGASEVFFEQVVEVVEAEGPAGAPSSPPPPHPATSQEIHTFAPLSAAARQVTMVLNELEFSVPVEAGFSIDFGDHPQPGQIFPVNQRFQVAGQDVLIPAARLSEKNISLGEDHEESLYLLEMLFSPEGKSNHDLLSLEVEIASSENQLGIGALSSSWGQPLFASFEIERIPVGVVSFRINRAEINLKGPWEISFDLPIEETGPAKVQHLRPGVSRRVNDVTVAIDEVTLTDRVTRVRISLPDLPEGAELVTAYSWFEEDKPVLADSAGHQLDYPRGVSWALPSGFDPDELVFASLSSLPGGGGWFGRPGALTLTLPTVAIFYPGAARLEVEVPSDVEFHPESVEEKASDEESYEFTRWFSDPWEVDLPVEIAGYRLRFNRARLELEANRIPASYWLELSADAPPVVSGKPRLVSLHPASSRRPNGTVEAIESSLPGAMFSSLSESYIAPQEPGSAKWVAFLRVDVTSPDGFGYLAGRYTVELDGAVVLVPGPWRLTW